MLIGVLLLAGRGSDPIMVILINSAVFLPIVVGMILWHLRYRRKWQQFRGRNWPQVQSKFDGGEIVTMYKGRTKSIAGYQVWLGYDYQADGEQTALYTLPFTGEFANTEEAEKCRHLVAHRDIIVHVSPRNLKRSVVLDEDVKLLINSGDSR